ALEGDVDVEGFEIDEADEGFIDEGDAVEQAFIDAMDAEDEDEFLRRVWGGLRRAARVAAPVLRRIGRRALPIGLRLLRQAARRIGGVAGQEIGGALGGGLANVLGGWLGGGQQADAMDALADVAADEAFSEDEIDEFVPVLAGMAGRYAVRALTTRRTRAAR